MCVFFLQKSLVISARNRWNPNENQKIFLEKSLGISTRNQRKDLTEILCVSSRVQNVFETKFSWIKLNIRTTLKTYSVGIRWFIFLATLETPKHRAKQHHTLHSIRKNSFVGLHEEVVKKMWRKTDFSRIKVRQFRRDMFELWSMYLVSNKKISF